MAMHDVPLLVNLAAGLAAAFVFGYITNRLGLSPMIGYVIAGFAIGPRTPGFVADQEIANQFAEVGVILLMFGVGLHFHLKDLFAVQAIALPGAVVQSLVATGLGAGLALLAGWSFGAGIVLGLAASVASTVVLIRVLLDNDRLESADGRVAVGWLVVEDIFTVLILVLLPILAEATGGTAGAHHIARAIGWAVLKLAALAALVLVGGGWFIPRLLAHVARIRSRELFTLCVLALALVIATGSAKFFGASMALGAFLAGMVVGQSRLSHQAAADALPLRDAFSVLFFVSVGMLFDPSVILDSPGLVVGTLAIVLLGKPLAAISIVAVLGYSARTALTVAVGLAQIGEFSFILAETARRLGMFPPEGQSVLVAAALFSISINPLLFRPLGAVEERLRRWPRLWALLNRRAEARGRAVNEATQAQLAEADVEAVVVGFGPVGQTVHRLLREFGVRTLIIDLNVDTATRVAADGELCIYGDAAQQDILISAGIERARYLLVTLPELQSRIPVIVTSRALNPELKILVRARYLNERSTLEDLGATAVCYEEAEAAVALADLLLREVGADAARLEAEEKKIREELALRAASQIPKP